MSSELWLKDWLLKKIYLKVLIVIKDLGVHHPVHVQDLVEHKINISDLYTSQVNEEERQRMFAIDLTAKKPILVFHVVRYPLQRRLHLR